MLLQPVRSVGRTDGQIRGKVLWGLAEQTADFPKTCVVPGLVPSFPPAA